MEVDKVESFISELKNITNNALKIDYNLTEIASNIFLEKIKESENFKDLTIKKVKRLINDYSNDNKKVIIENVEKLFKNNWDGAYSELTAYDFLNLVFDNKCEIQVENIELEQTLAKYCPDAKKSTIDGYLEDYFTYFEVKTLASRCMKLLDKIKHEVECYDENNYFKIKSNCYTGLEIKNNAYSELKNEILEAKRKRQSSLDSKVVDGLHLTLIYEKKKYLFEYHTCENSFAMAERLERLPLEHYKQFVTDGKFIKIFVCNSLCSDNFVRYDKDFFRSLARRVFCKLTKEEKIFDNNSKLKTSDIARCLGGLMFIVDLSPKIKEEIEKPENLYEVYFYKNPNTDIEHSLLDIGFAHEYLHKAKSCICDDFRFDNY